MRQSIICIAAIFSFSVHSSSIPTILETSYFDSISQHEDSAMGINAFESAGYFTNHLIRNVIENNPNLYTPNFKVGVTDSGLIEQQPDLHKFVNIGALNPNTDSAHGTAVFGISFGSQPENQIGTLGITNSFTNFISYPENEEPAISFELTFDWLNEQESRIINGSIALRPQTSHHALAHPLTKAEEIAHVKDHEALRRKFKLNPQKLYIFAAGNSASYAKWNNGAIHYVVNSTGDDIVLDKLDNVIVVAAMGYDNNLHYYSDFGESIDVATTSGVYAPAAFEGRLQYYDGLKYGMGRFNNDLGSGGFKIETEDYHLKIDLPNFDGTSAASPITAGMASLLLSMDPSMSGAELKDALIDKVSSVPVYHRWTGKKICIFPSFCKLATDFEGKIENLPHNPIPIINLWERYNTLKLRLGNEAIIDLSNLNNKTANISNTNDCTIFWQQNNAERDVIGPKKVYESLFYGNKCLYFRGNSFIIEYDIPSKLAKSLYYGDTHYDEYQTVRKFINNMKSARTDETWRQGYGVGLNSSGNVACLSADGSACTQPLTTPQQCENIWEALTGVLPSTIYFRKTYIKEGVCSYSQFERIIVNYNSNNNEINIYTGVNYYSSFPERLENLNQLEQVLDTLQPYRDNPFNCFFKLHDIFRDKIPPQLKIIQGYERRCAIIIHNGDIEDISDFSKVPHIYLSPRHGSSHDPVRLNRFDKWNQFALNKLNKLYPNGPDRSKTYRSIFDSICKEQTESSNQKLCKERSSRYQNIRFTYEHGIWFNALTYRISRGDATMYAQVRNNLYQ